MNMPKIALLLLLGLWVLPLAAQQSQEPPQALPVPPPPPPVESGEVLEPDVRIIQKPGQVIREYRVNGVLYMVEIRPDSGPAYYYVDYDGDGRLESRRIGGVPEVVAPQWVIFSW